MSETPLEPASTPVPLSAGALLRQARERSGLHIGALSVSLKVPVQRLEALEADRYDLLPSPVFIRALALSVCRSLKLDAQPILALLPDAAKPDLKIEGSLNEPFRSPSRSGTGSSWPPLSAPALWLAGALVLGAIALFFWPDKGLESPNPEPKSPTGSVVTEPVRPLALTPAGALAPQSPPSAPLSAPPAAAALSAPTPAGPASPKDAAPPLLLLKAEKPSWVEVVDGAGQAVLRRTLAEGEQVPVTAATALWVTIGNAGGVSVLVRGSPLDLAASTQGNVARFEVK